MREREEVILGTNGIEFHRRIETLSESFVFVAAKSRKLQKDKTSAILPNAPILATEKLLFSV